MCLNTLDISFITSVRSAAIKKEFNDDCVIQYNPRRTVTFICVEKTAFPLESRLGFSVSVIPRDSREHLLHTAAHLSAPSTMHPGAVLPSQVHEKFFLGTGPPLWSAVWYVILKQVVRGPSLQSGRHSLSLPSFRLFSTTLLA